MLTYLSSTWFASSLSYIFVQRLVFELTIPPPLRRRCRVALAPSDRPGSRHRCREGDPRPPRHGGPCCTRQPLRFFHVGATASGARHNYLEACCSNTSGYMFSGFVWGRECPCKKHQSALEAKNHPPLEVGLSTDIIWCMVSLSLQGDG